MSWMRKAQSLGGMDGFPQDAFFQRRLNAVAQHQVYPGYAEMLSGNAESGRGERAQPAGHRTPRANPHRLLAWLHRAPRSRISEGLHAEIPG